MATVRTPRRSWVKAGLDALAAGGPQAVRVEAIARHLGVSKGGFYWHFDDREALLREMLDAWERESVDDVINEIDGKGGNERARLRRLFELASSTEGGRIDLAVRDWARRDSAARARLRRVDNRRIAYMRSLFGAILDDADEIEARCVIALSLFVGMHFIAADHGRGEARTREAMTRWLLGPA